MKEINLTQNKIALVDDEDFERLNEFKWHAHWHGQNWYAVRSDTASDGKHKTVLMHREILNAPKGIQVDHGNGNGLDNQKTNIRICTKQQNAFNRRLPQKGNRLSIKGVCWDKKNKKFRAQIGFNSKQIHLGYFKKLDDADIAHRQAEIEYFGEFARESSKRYIKILNPEYQMSLTG